MSPQRNDTLFSGYVIMFITGVLLTGVGGVWLHWIVLLFIALVSGWSSQSMGKKRKPRNRQ